MGNGVWLVGLGTFTLILNYDCLAGRNDYWQSKNRKVFESWKFEVNIIELPSWKHAFFFQGLVYQLQDSQCHLSFISAEKCMKPTKRDLVMFFKRSLFMGHSYRDRPQSGDGNVLVLPTTWNKRNILSSITGVYMCLLHVHRYN